MLRADKLYVKFLDASSLAEKTERNDSVKRSKKSRQNLSYVLIVRLAYVIVFSLIYAFTAFSF